jgi:hypothetical protein
VYAPSTYSPKAGDTVSILGNGSCATSVTATQVTGLFGGSYVYSQSAYASYIYSQSAYTASCATNCYYISPSGSDANAGTSAAAPWKTFGHAVPLLFAGDTLNLLNGTYTKATTGLFLANCSSGAHTGTSSAHVTIQSLNERQAFIQGVGSAETFEIANCSYWDVIGIHGESSDVGPTGVSTGDVFNFFNSNHLTIRRNIAARPNRFGNVHAILLYNTNNSLVEENEVYFFHRHGIIDFGGGFNNEFRRNYANPRHWPVISGQYGVTDTFGIDPYTSNSDVFENNIAEDPGNTGLNPTLFNTLQSALNVENTASNNHLLGNIAGVGAANGIRIGPHAGQPEPTGNSFVNNVALPNIHIGFWGRSSKSTWDHNSAFGNSSGIGGFISDTDSCCSYSTYSFVVTNSTAQGFSAGAGYQVINTSGNTFSFDHDNNVGNATTYSPNLNITNANSANPAFGSCYLWVPDASPLKGAGTNGSDIGANILFAYSGGNLTNAKLWNADGSFVGRGAIVLGLNDVAGSSLFDIQNRLNVNKNGCALPVGY